MVALRPPADAVLIRYINRLSDLLFVLARVVNHRAGTRRKPNGDPAAAPIRLSCAVDRRA